MALTWSLAELRASFRELTGRSTIGEIADATVNDIINEYYQQFFPEDVNVAEFFGEITQLTSPTDSGQYTLAQTVIRIEAPVYINNTPIALYLDKGSFFATYTDEDDFITSPTFVIGTVSAAAVKNAAFYYRINDWSYSKVSVETALSGSTIPQNKYGAWALEIDTAGTITIVQAPNNGTGYDTAAKAVAALTSPSSGKCWMGYVTAINTSGAFIPGTTLLNAAGVTATFTNGLENNRGEPIAALIFENKIYLRPKADDIYQFKAMVAVSRPTTLSGDTIAIVDVKWGQAIAAGAAMMWLLKFGEMERIAELQPYMNYLLASIRHKQLRQKTGNPVKRRF